MKKRTKMQLFIMLLPFIDVITSLMTRNIDFPVTLGIVIKTIFLLYLTYYIITTKSKYQKLSIINLAFIGFYIISYFIFKPDIINPKYLLTEFQFMFKLIYGPITFLGLLCFYDENNFSQKEMLNIFKYTLIIYVLLLIIPILTKTAYTTYPKDLKGYIGWFYAGNEIANIMILLYPATYLFISKKKFTFLISMPIIYTILLIGTKVSTFGVLALSIITFIFIVISNKFKLKKSSFYALIILLITIAFSFNSYAIYNYKYNLEHNYKEEQEEIVIEKENVNKVNNVRERMAVIYNNRFFKALLSGRDMLLANTVSVYNDIDDDTSIFFGIGFSNTKEINNKNIAKLIEIDICDGYFHFGIFGLLIMMMPILLSIYIIITSKQKITLFSIYIFLIIILLGGISTLSGHVFLAPAVSIYLVLYLLLLLNEYNALGRNYKLKNKVSILSLHLGYGGIEKSIVDQANMISERYEVEIVTLYNLIDNIPYNINKKVKIIYLSNLKPNKKEFLENLKNRKIISCIKEGFKSLYILYQKKNLIDNYIYNSTSKIIISTRLDFTKSLNRYANLNAITIAEEHVYHQNNKKYIKTLEKNLSNINYLLPASHYLTDDYQKAFSNDLVKVKYIPETINYLPSKTSKCNNKNIITVARLSKEKGLEDLLKTFKEVIKKDPEITLTIVGDGEEKENLLNLARDLKIIDNIRFTGYLNQNELKKEYENASLFVMTSHEESFGLVLLEAFSYNIPCFAFDSALGAQELIDKTCGKLIPDRNIKLMAQEIVSYFNGAKNEYAGKEKAKNYLTDNVKKIWFDFINEILSKSNSKNVIFISSTGGHLNELLKLQKTMEKYNSYIITEKNNLKLKYKVFYLMKTTRYQLNYLYGIFYNIFKSLYYFIKINPDVIVSTGSHTAVAMCYIGKIFNKKIIYIESFANITSKSLAGKLVYPIADTFIIQWKEMQKLYPKAKYWGCLY